MKQLFLFFIIALCLSLNACKAKDGSNISTKEVAAANGVIVPKSGFSPVTHGTSLDPEREKKVKEALGTDNYEEAGVIKITNQLLSEWQKKGLEKIEARKKEDNNKIYESWAHNTWILDAVYVDDFGPTELTEGRWVEFKHDFTYEYGKYDTSLGNGKYHYSPSDELLILVDNDPAVKPLEFINGWDMGFTVIGGTDTYDDKKLMIKLINKPNRPNKTGN